MKRFDQIVAWLLLLLALRAAAVAAREFAQGSAPWPAGFWMLGTGMLLGVCGALSLLRIRYGDVAPGLRTLAALTAIGVAVLLLSAGIVGGEFLPSAFVAVLLCVNASMAFGARRHA
jgi:hypothetical protein